jgi:hypothetical protein
MKNRSIIIIIAILGFIAISIFGIIWIINFLKIDSCLDKGGRWNYELNKCEVYYNLDSLNLTDLYWHTVSDTILNKEFLEKGKFLDSLSKSPAELIDVLNRRKPVCKIEYVHIIGDTITIKINSEEYLTEQMGSTGAYCFLGETVFTLTESKLIKFVRFEMEYGSHAGPGLYNRNDFLDLKKE